MFGLFFVICLSCTGSVAQVTLSLVGGKPCSGDNLTFFCEASGTDTLVWTISALPGLTIPMNNFGMSLTVFDRITSTDDTTGPDPSMITIHNVTEADRGATVQCRIVKGNMSNIITLSIRPIECSVILNSSAATDTSVTVTIIWTNCLGTEPESVSLRWSPTEDPNTVSTRDINTQTPAIITGLQPNTSYTIMVNFSDACGSIANMTNAVTQPERNMPGGSGDNGTTSDPLVSPPIDVIVGSIVGGLIVVTLVVIIIVVAVLVFKHMKKNKTHGEKLTAHHGEEMVDVHGDATYAAPGKDKATVEGGDGVYSYAATTTVVGAKHSKPDTKPGKEMVAEDASAQPEKPKRGSKKQPPPSDVPHKQGPVGDLYAMPDKKAPDVGHKAGPQGDMYAMAAKPSKGGYGAEGPN